MIEIAEMLRPEPTALWTLAKQAGVNHAVTGLARDEGGSERPWDYAALLRTKTQFDRAGIEVAVIESSPPMQKIRLGLPGRDEEIEWFCTMLTNMGTLGIKVLCYNFMAQIGWSRTRVDIRSRGGALISGYDHAEMESKGLTEAGIVS